MSSTTLYAELLQSSGRVPCSRYGYDTRSCGPVAFAVALIVEAETGEEMTAEALSHAMGLVVNDHDDPAELLQGYGPEYGFSWTEAEGLQDLYGTVTDATEEALR